MKRSIAAILVAASLSGCATVEYGDKGTEAKLRRFEPTAGKVSFYLCREDALLVAAGVRSVVWLDGKAIGTVKPNMFVHADIDPGQHSVFLRHDGIATGSSGVETFEARAGEVKIMWAGVTGHGWGVLTVDTFDSVADGKACVSGAAYSIAPGSGAAVQEAAPAASGSAIGGTR